MTKRGRASLSPEAETDLASILHYIATESGKARARAVRARIRRSIATIAQMPRSGRERAELPRSPRSYSVSPWIVFYRPANDGGVEVVRILDGRMDIPNHFKEL